MCMYMYSKYVYVNVNKRVIFYIYFEMYKLIKESIGKILNNFLWIRILVLIYVY